MRSWVSTQLPPAATPTTKIPRGTRPRSQLACSTDDAGRPRGPWCRSSSRGRRNAASHQKGGRLRTQEACAGAGEHRGAGVACALAAATRAPTLVFHLHDDAGATTSEFTRNSGGDPHCHGYTCRCPSLCTAREDKDGRPRRGACATSCTRTANMPAKAPSATTVDGVVSGPSGMMSTRRAAWMATPSSVPALRPSAVMPADRGREAALARRW